MVGAVATIMHDHARLSADIDLILDLEEEEARWSVRALTAYDLKSRALVNPEEIVDRRIKRDWIRGKRGVE